MEGTGPLCHIDQLSHFGAEGVAGGLVDLVAVGCGEHLGIAGQQPGGESGGPGNASDHNVTGIAVGQHRPRFCGGESALWDGDDRTQRGMDGQPERHAFRRCQHQAAVDSGCGLIGVPFHVGRDAEHPLRMGLLPDRPQRGRSTGYESRCGRPDATGERHRIVHLDLEGPIPDGLAGRGHHPVVLLVARTLQTDMAHHPLLRRSGTHLAARDQGEGDAVEPGPEVGRGRGCRSGGPFVHYARLSRVTVPPVGDIFDFDNLLPELILALGLALLIGNGLAWWKHRKGEAPEGVDEAQYRPGRVRFLSVVGLLLTIWGAVTLFT